MANKTTDQISPMADAQAPDPIQDIERPPMTNWQLHHIPHNPDQPSIYIDTITIPSDLSVQDRVRRLSDEIMRLSQSHPLPNGYHQVICGHDSPYWIK